MLSTIIRVQKLLKGKNKKVSYFVKQNLTKSIKNSRSKLVSQLNTKLLPPRVMVMINTIYLIEIKLITNKETKKYYELLQYRFI